MVATRLALLLYSEKVAGSIDWIEEKKKLVCNQLVVQSWHLPVKVAV